MKFNCGGTSSEESYRKFCERYDTAVKWHDCFLWWPTRIGPHDCRWLETVERMFEGNKHQFIWFTEFYWKYRAKR